MSSTGESHLDEAPCRVCGRPISKFHGHGRLLTLRHVSILGHNTFIRIQPKRSQCPYCAGNPTGTQQGGWDDERSPHANAYEPHLVCQLVNRTIEDVSQQEEVGDDAVLGVLNRRIETEVNGAEIERLERLGIDEISLKKGHNDFVTIVNGRSETHLHLLAGLPDRKKDTVTTCLLSIPPHIHESLTSVCCDLNEGVLNAAKEGLSRGVGGSRRGG